MPNNSYIERSNKILSTFDISYFGINKQMVDLSNNLIFYMDDGPFSENESIYIQISAQPSPDQAYSMLVLKARSTDQAISTLFAVTSNTKSGISIENTNHDEFSIKIDTSIDVSKITFLVSKLGVISKQEAFYDEDEPVLDLYSDIFTTSPVRYSFDDKIKGTMCEYSILNNREFSLMTIYRSIQNLTYYRGVSPDGIQKMQESIIFESVAEMIGEKLKYTDKINYPAMMFPEYTAFLKSTLKILAFLSETNDIPLILYELDNMKLDTSEKLNEILEICYRKIALKNEDLERQLLDFF